MIPSKHGPSYLERLLNDFTFYTLELWKDRRLDKVAPLSEIELDIAAWTAQGPRRRGVCGFRGIGKTHIIAALTTFRGRRDPRRNIIIPSKSLDAPKKTVHLIRSWIDRVWFLQEMIPRRGQRDAATYFDFGTCTEDIDGRQASVVAIGNEGMLENNRAHSIFPDDVETKKNTTTHDARAALKKIVKEYSSILYPDRPHADGGPVDPVEIVYIGTPKHEESLYFDLEKEGTQFRSYPIRIPAPEDQVFALAPIIRKKIERLEVQPGDPLLPLRFGELEIADREKEGYTEFGMEHLLLKNLAQTNLRPLRLADLIVMDVARDIGPLEVIYGTQDHNGSTVIEDIACYGLGQDRLYRPAKIGADWAPWMVTKAGLDPAGVGDDRTGLGIVSALGGRLFTKALHGFPGGVDDDSLDRIVLTLRRHGATEVHLETNNDVYGTYQQALIGAIARHRLLPDQSPEFPLGWSCSVVPTRAHGQKELRILATLEPFISSHRMVVDRAAIAPDPAEDIIQTAQYQMTRLTKQPKCLKEDGIIDAWEIACRSLNTTLATSTDKAARRAKNTLLSRILQDRTNAPAPNWINR